MVGANRVIGRELQGKIQPSDSWGTCERGKKWGRQQALKMKNSRKAVRAVLLAGTLCIGASGNTNASEPDVAVEAPSIDTVLYWGFEYNRASSRQDGFGIDGGFVTALNGNLDLSGWIVTGNLGYSESNSRGSDTDSIYASALAGHLWQTSDFYVSLAGGLHYINNDENPSGGITDGDKVGVIAQYGFETKRVEAPYVQSYGSYSTAYDSVYAHIKAGYKTHSLKYGAELTGYDEKGGKGTIRYGAFVGDIPLGQLTMGVSAGYQDELEPGNKDGFYALTEFSMPLSLR